MNIGRVQPWDFHCHLWRGSKKHLPERGKNSLIQPRNERFLLHPRGSFAMRFQARKGRFGERNPLLELNKSPLNKPWDVPQTSSKSVCFSSEVVFLSLRIRDVTVACFLSNTFDKSKHAAHLCRLELNRISIHLFKTSKHFLSSFMYTPCHPPCLLSRFSISTLGFSSALMMV